MAAEAKIQRTRKTTSDVATDLQTGHFSVAVFAASIITELDVPLTWQTTNDARILTNHSVEDVLQHGSAGIISSRFPGDILTTFVTVSTLSVGI